MRDIYLADDQGRIIDGEGYCGLSYQVWEAAFNMVKEHQFNILTTLWKHYFGSDGDSLLTPDEVKQLLDDIRQIKPYLNDIAELKTEINVFFDELQTLSGKAVSNRYSLKFIAD